jgi:hypothetical protein
VALSLRDSNYLGFHTAWTLSGQSAKKGKWLWPDANLPLVVLKYGHRGLPDLRQDGANHRLHRGARPDRPQTTTRDGRIGLAGQITRGTASLWLFDWHSPPPTGGSRQPPDTGRDHKAHNLS